MSDDHEREPVEGMERVTRRETSRAELVFWLGIGGFVAVPAIALGAASPLAVYLFMAISLLCSALAWLLGHREVSAIDAGRLPRDGLSHAIAGRRMGIIMSVLWALSIAFVIFACAFWDCLEGM
jgi:hypothetical protein